MNKTDQATVPSARCSKCGSDDTGISYCDASAPISGQRPADRCGNGEHFHRRCNRCYYGWRTDDVLKPEASK